MKEFAAAVAVASTVNWCQAPGSGKGERVNPALEEVGDDEPTLRILSRQGAASTDELEALGAPGVVFRVDGVGSGATAIAFDYSEFGYEGSTGTELARMNLDGDAVVVRMERDFQALDLNDQDIKDELDAAAESAKKKCPECTHEHAGDVAATTISFARVSTLYDDLRIRLFHRSDMYKPEGEETPKYDRLFDIVKYAFGLRAKTLDEGVGKVAEAVALAKAEQAKRPDELKGVFKGSHCDLVRETGAVPPVPDRIVCRAFGEGYVEGSGDGPLSIASVEITQLPEGPIAIEVPTEQ